MTDGTTQGSELDSVLTLNNDGTVRYGIPMTQENLAKLAKLAESSQNGHSLALVFLCNEVLKLRLELEALKVHTKRCGTGF